MKRFSFFCVCALMVAAVCSCSQNERGDFPYDVPEEYLEEAEDIPSYWIATTTEVEAFLKSNVRKGELKLLGKEH